MLVNTSHPSRFSRDQVACGRAAVTAAAAAAAETGIDVLRAGGNAFDAAIAAAMVETVWLPMKCGLAGDVVALYQRAGGDIEAMLAIGRGPLALAKAARLEPTGPASVGGAGAPEGYAALAAMGRLPLGEIIAPARRMAEVGVRWTETAVALTQEAESLLRRWNEDTRFLPSGRLPQPGESLILPGLARLLDRFAELGPTLFHGDVGEAVATRVRSAGGFLSRDDLLRAVTTTVPPLTIALPDGRTLWTTPHPTQGKVLGEAFIRLADGAGELEAIAAARDAFGAGAFGGTSVVTAADSEGNRVVLVHSNSFPQYGSGLVLSEYDLVLNNRPGRGFGFHVPEGHWNAPSPLRVPATTLHAWCLRMAGAEFWGGTPGGENQAPWNLQALSALGDGAEPIEAITRPKWGFSRTGEIVFEEDHPLRSRNSRTVRPLGLRSAEQILKICGPSSITAAADPRTGSVARAIPFDNDV